MTGQQWLAVGLGILLLAFIWFAFRQGFRVKPDPERKRNTGVLGTWLYWGG
jgi:cbb3-type cytochrome oxidase subunit 3